MKILPLMAVLCLVAIAVAGCSRQGLVANDDNNVKIAASEQNAPAKTITDPAIVKENQEIAPSGDLEAEILGENPDTGQIIVPEIDISPLS